MVIDPAERKYDMGQWKQKNGESVQEKETVY